MMIKNSIKNLVVLGALLTSVPVFAADGPPQPTYIKANSIDYLKVVSAPPTFGSKKSDKDFKIMFQFQQTRTMEECDRASLVATKYKLANLFGDRFGSLTPDEVKLLSPFFKTVQDDTGFVSYQVKTHWKRPRPYAEDKNIVPCANVEKENSASYPSGHTTVSRVFARILSKLDPSRKHEFMKRADEVASDRVMSGLHHPSDIKAGKKLGDEIYRQMMKDEKFKDQLKSLKVSLEVLDHDEPSTH